MSTIKIVCPNNACRTEGQVDESKVGTTVTCKRCQTSFVVQASGESPFSSGAPAAVPSTAVPSDPATLVAQFTQHLQAAGVNVVFQELNPTAKQANFQYSGVNLTLLLEWVGAPIFALTLGLGFIPQANLVALYRRLLDMNATGLGWCFSIDHNEAVVLRSSGRLQSVDAAEVKLILNTLAASYFQHCVPIQQQFQLPAQK